MISPVSLSHLAWSYVKLLALIYATTSAAKKALLATNWSWALINALLAGPGSGYRFPSLGN